MYLNKIFCCDALKGFKKLPDNSINSIVTSPPYYSLRSYLNDNHPDKKLEIGLENTPQHYIDNLVRVFREGRRVLKSDGNLWIVIGDSYANFKNKGSEKIRFQSIHKKSRGEPHTVAPNRNGSVLKELGLKDKDLIGIPWMLALALREDGWWLRQTLIWHKPSCMPESAKDRCTNNFEYILLLTKNKNYFFDYKAIEEDAVYPAGTKAAKGSVQRLNKKGVNAVSTKYKIYTGRRRKRSVWSVNPSKEKICAEHTAVFPQKLIEPMILAGCPQHGIVCDPFAGLFTVGIVCHKLNRKYVLFELNPEYCKIGEKRLNTLQTEFQYV